MEDNHPSGMWLRASGCCNGATWVTVEVSANGFMYFTHEWKNFIRAHCMGQGHALHFELIEPDTLSVKFFGASGARLGCCAESLSDSYTTSSSHIDKEGDNDDDLPGIKAENLDSD